MTRAAPQKSVTPRALARERTMRRIVELGNAQLARHGAADLSVREVARGLDLVSSAIYRYVRSRDDLLTLLIADAFGDLAGVVDDAVTAADGDARSRFLALAEAMTGWALAHPERWTLLYGTPVRGYHAPADTTNDAGTRVIRQMLVLAADATAERGPTEPEEGPAPDPDVRGLLEESLEELGVATDAATGIRALTVWSSLVGVISAHVFGQLGPDAVAVGEKVIAAQTLLLADVIAPR